MIRAREANKKDYFYFKKYGAQKKKKKDSFTRFIRACWKDNRPLLIETSLSFGQQYIIWNKNSYIYIFLFFLEFLLKTIARWIRGIFEAFCGFSMCFYVRTLCKKGKSQGPPRSQGRKEEPWKRRLKSLKNWNEVVRNSNRITLRLGSRFLWLIK